VLSGVPQAVVADEKRPTSTGFHLTARWVVCSFVVKMIGGDPVFDDRLLRVADVEQSVTHQIAQHRIQPILGLRIPFRFDAAAGLWPEIGHVVAAAKADGHKVVDFIVGMRSPWQSVAGKNFITQRIAEVAMLAGVTADLEGLLRLSSRESMVERVV